MYYGLFMGLIFIANFLVTLLPSVSFLQYPIIGVIIYLTFFWARNCRDTLLDGVISYGRALLYVIQLFIYSSMISSIFKYIFYTFISPETLKRQINDSMLVMEKTAMFDSAQMEELHSSMLELITPVNMALQSIWVNLFLGLALGLVLAGFLRKEKSIFDQDFQEN